MDKVDTINLADVQSKPTLWTWDNYIPTGTVTVLLGDGGIGKSMLSLAIAAAVTRGMPLPNSDTPNKPRNVIIQNAENALATVVKPRLEMLGADCSRVHSINESEIRLTLSDDRIEAAIVQHNAALLVVDPIQSYLGTSVSMNRAESVRLVLTRLEQIAERTKSAILLVGHLNKGSGKAQYRGLGSVDIFNSVPSVLYLGKSDEDDDVRILCHGKSNLVETAKNQAFKIKRGEGFQWLGECEDISVDELLAYRSPNSRDEKVREAMEFLEEVLMDGSLPSTEVIELADDDGISEKTLYRAKKKLGVESDKQDGQWYWSLADGGEDGQC